MKQYKDMTQAELQKELSLLQTKYEEVCALGLKLDMSRGKPEFRQADISADLLTALQSRSDLLAQTDENTYADAGNYGYPMGHPLARKWVADFVGAVPSEVYVGGNASLHLMYLLVSFAFCYGIAGEEPWCRQMAAGRKLKFICPVPGYDRHFAITESFGLELVSVPLLKDGPDMDRVEALAEDPDVKGIWCVPLYSNPSGVCYSDEVVKRFACLKPAAKDFRIFWDNAYRVHYLYPWDECHLLSLRAEAARCGNRDLVYEFFSTSKITIAGDGFSALITSENNLAEVSKYFGLTTVGFDKVNQLRHVRFFETHDIKGIMAHHAMILRPKFALVLDSFEKELQGLGIAAWTKPKGGYFISLDVLSGTARRVTELCKQAGLTITGADACFPYHLDPNNTNLRIAPSYPAIEELRKACDVLTLCVRLAAVEFLLQ